MKKLKIIFQALFRRLLAHWKKPAAPVAAPAPIPLPPPLLFPFPVHSGDLVWCLMPLPQKELDQIPEGHQIRPYWIAAVKADHVTGFYCSSKTIKKCPTASQFVISNAVTQIRDTHVDLRRIFRIPVANLIEPICPVPAVVQNQANKRLILQHRQNQNRPAFRFPVPLVPAPGDLLHSHGLILDCSEQRCTIVPRCKPNAEGAVGGRINNRVFYFNARQTQTLLLSELTVNDIAGLADWELLSRIRLENKKVRARTSPPKHKQNAYVRKPAPFACGQILEEWGGQQYVFLCATRTHQYGYVYDDFMPDKLVCLKSDLIVTHEQLPEDQLNDDLEALIEVQENPQMLQLLRQVQKQKDLPFPFLRSTPPRFRISVV